MFGEGTICKGKGELTTCGGMASSQDQDMLRKFVLVRNASYRHIVMRVVSFTIISHQDFNCGTLESTTKHIGKRKGGALKATIKCINVNKHKQHIAKEACNNIAKEVGDDNNLDGSQAKLRTSCSNLGSKGDTNDGV